MPQVQVVDTTRDKPEPTDVERFFTRLGKDYKDREDRVEIGKILDEYSQNRNEYEGLKKAKLDLERSNISPSRRIELIKNLNESEKNIIARDKALNKSYETKLSEFDKTRQKKGAEELSKIETEIPKIQDSLTNLDTIERVFKKELRGPTGYVKAAFNSKAAKEVENLSVSSLDTIIKMFNPAGTLPTAKLNWIRDTFAVKAGDLTSTMQGKVNAQRTLAKQALRRGQEKSRLLKQYQGLIPDEVENQFNQETLAENDALADQMAFELKLQEAKESGLVRNMYDQEGDPLDPIPTEEAIKLFQEGLITNEPR